MGSEETRFTKYEKIFLRINLAILGAALIIYLIYQFFIEHTGPFVDYLMSVIIIGFFGVIVIFFISVFRIIKYIVKHRTEEGSSIWRSVLNIFLSPLSLIILYLLIFITSIASCTYAG